MPVGITKDAGWAVRDRLLSGEAVRTSRSEDPAGTGKGRPMPGEAPGPLSAADLTPGGVLGRSAETAAIRRMRDGERLVTVTGLPGVGKTAVSLVAATAAAGNFADGTLLVRLDPLRDEALLPHTILAALGLPDRFASSPLEVLTDQL